MVITESRYKHHDLKNRKMMVLLDLKMLTIGTKNVKSRVGHINIWNRP